MEISDLIASAGTWLQGTGPENDVVISTRVRLAKIASGNIRRRRKPSAGEKALVASSSRPASIQGAGRDAAGEEQSGQAEHDGALGLGMREHCGSRLYL